MKRILLAAGGTGGHIFPAIATAQVLKKRRPDIEILFVGSAGGMEERLVPDAGFNLRTLRIAGLRRRLTTHNIIRNLMFPFKFLSSLREAHAIVKAFRPDVAVGYGGFAGYPAVRAAATQGIPTAIMEQNAFPGLANRKLAPRVNAVLLGNPAAKAHFPKEKVIVTGNPIRPELFKGAAETGLARYKFASGKPVLLVLGGSLGAKSINEAMTNHIDRLLDDGLQVLWQCGKGYYETLKNIIPEHPQLRLVPFISDMGDVYAMADLVVSRAGAISIAEIECLGKPAILVPSPNVAEDHQTANARSVADLNAAILLPDADLATQLGETVLQLTRNTEKLSEMQNQLKRIAKPNAADAIVDKLLTMI